MKYNLMALLAALSLVTCAYLGVNAGTFVGNADFDIFSDEEDNCINVFNYEQNDTDGDGYGNVCDSDLNQDGKVNAVDFIAFNATYGMKSGDLVDHCTYPGDPWDCCTGAGTGSCLYRADANYDCKGGPGGDVGPIDFITYKALFGEDLAAANGDLDCAGPPDVCDKVSCASVPKEIRLQIDVEPGLHVKKGYSDDLPIQMWIPKIHVDNVDIGIIRFTPKRSTGSNIVVQECTLSSWQACDGTDSSPDWMVDDAEEGDPFYGWSCRCKAQGEGYPDIDWQIEMHVGLEANDSYMIDSDVAEEYYRDFRTILNVPFRMATMPTEEFPKVEWNTSAGTDETDSNFGLYDFNEEDPPDDFVKVANTDCASINPHVTVADW